MAGQRIDLNNFLNIVDKEMSSLEKGVEVRPLQETIDIKSYIDQVMITAETVGISYNSHEDRAEVYTNRDGVKHTEYFNIDPEEYKDCCGNYCNNIDDKFNHSNFYMDSFGNLVRVFSILPPVTDYPNITINVSRKIDDYSLKELPDQVRNMIPFIIANRFIIVGQTGSGKTYFLNRALKYTFSGKFDQGYSWDVQGINREQAIRSGNPSGGGTRVEMSSTKLSNKIIIPKNISSNRIAFCEEFHELFPPNENTICLDACPVKPGEENIFAYIIQQTNLMRLDNIFVGEIKGPESFYFINNLTSSIRGGTTCHGSNALDGLLRLRILMTLSGFCSIDLAGQLIANALDFVIYIEHHKIKEIRYVTGVYNSASQKFQTELLYEGV